MIIAFGYVAIVVIATFAQVRMTRNRARQQWQVNACFAIIVAYMILAQVLWLLVLEAIDQPRAVWIATLLALQIIAVILAVAPQAERDDSAQRRIMWTLAAALRRPYRDIDTMRHKHRRVAQ